MTGSSRPGTAGRLVGLAFCCRKFGQEPLQFASRPLSVDKVALASVLPFTAKENYESALRGGGDTATENSLRVRALMRAICAKVTSKA
jgi:hypothetical protein